MIRSDKTIKLMNKYVTRRHTKYRFFFIHHKRYQIVKSVMTHTSDCASTGVSICGISPAADVDGICVGGGAFSVVLFRCSQYDRSRYFCRSESWSDWRVGNCGVSSSCDVRSLLLLLLGATGCGEVWADLPPPTFDCSASSSDSAIASSSSSCSFSLRSLKYSNVRSMFGYYKRGNQLDLEYKNLSNLDQQISLLIVFSLFKNLIFQLAQP